MTVCVGSYCSGGENSGIGASTNYARIVSYYGQRLADQLGPICLDGYSQLVTDIDFAGYSRHATQAAAARAASPWLSDLRDAIRSSSGGGQLLTKTADQAVTQGAAPTVCTFQNASGTDSAILLVGGNTYRVEWKLIYRTSALTANMNLQVNFTGTATGSPTIALAQNTSLTNVVYGVASAFDANVGSPAAGPGSVDVPCTLTCSLAVAASGGGLLRLRYAASGIAAGTATIRTGSSVLSAQVP